MCLVQRYVSDGEAVTCDTTDDCNSAPFALPAGGSRYCVAPNNSGTKFCHYRPGNRADYCAGSPALELAPVRADSYRIDIAAPQGSQWLALACFNACADLPPSISGSVTVR
jgi:hypothetical protein